MKKWIIPGWHIWLLVILLFGFGFAFLGPVQAAPLAQMTPFPTPTPGSDGRIIYIVQPGDTLWRISAVTGISIPDLRDMNNLDPDDVVVIGQQLFLGTGGPAEEEETPIIDVSPTPSEPTQTPPPGVGTLCVILFEDENGDSMRQEEEVSLPGGAINISNREGTVSITEDTPAHSPSAGESDYVCTEDLKEGEYNVSVAVPEGYNPTTSLNTAVTLEPGDTTYLTFGAQANSETAAEEAPAVEGPGNSPILGIIGVVMLLGGVGLGVYAIWFRK
ncbi:MAG: LysM peptidoglycan-binding domain-containing protein [Anaerolineales bacterium]